MANTYYMDTTIYRWKDITSGAYLTDDEYNEMLELGLPEWIYEDMEIEVEIQFVGCWEDDDTDSEFWGFRKVSHDRFFTVEEIEKVADKQGRDWYNELTKDEIETITHECEEYGEEASKYDDD